MDVGTIFPDPGLRFAAVGKIFHLGPNEWDDSVHEAVSEAVEWIDEDDTLWTGSDDDRAIDIDTYANKLTLVRTCLEAFGTISVEQDELDRLTSFSSGGGFFDTWLEGTLAEELDLEPWQLNTGGESDLYLINSLQGISALSSMTSLNLDSYGYSSETRDAAHLVGLDKLEVIELYGARLENTHLLAELPALTRVLHHMGSLDAATIELLHGKGVEVTD